MAVLTDVPYSKHTAKLYTVVSSPSRNEKKKSLKKKFVPEDKKKKKNPGKEE